MLNCYNEVFRLFTSDKGLEEYSQQLAADIQKLIQNINNLLKNHQDNVIYFEVNNLIHRTLLDKKKELNLGKIPKNKIDILDTEKKSKPVQDYIKYYLDNKDILFDTESERSSRFYDWTNLVSSYSNYIYAYFVYFVFIFFVFSHYLYYRINDIMYMFIMIAIISIYFTYGYMSYMIRYVY